MAPWRLLVLTLAVLSCAQALEIPPNWKQQCPITTIKVFTIVRPPLSVQAPAEGSGWDVKSGVEVCEDETHDQDTCAGIPCCQWDEDDKKCRSAVGTSTCMESVQRAYGKAGGDAAGFSHDFVNNVALSAFGQGQYAITSEFMPKGQQNNNGIFAKLRKSADDPTPTESCNPKKADGTFSCVVCLGVASISITAERETSLDFLPSYFQAGMKVLVESRIDMWKMIWGIVILLLQVLSQVLAFFLFFTLLLAPMVWVFEMMSMANTKGLPVHCYVHSDTHACSRTLHTCIGNDRDDVVGSTARSANLHLAHRDRLRTAPTRRAVGRSDRRHTCYPCGKAELPAQRPHGFHRDPVADERYPVDGLRAGRRHCGLSQVCGRPRVARQRQSLAGWLPCCLTPAARQGVLVQLAAWISCPWPVLQRLSLTSDAEISISSSMGLWWPSACMSCACLLPEAKGGFMHRSDEVEMLEDHVRETMSTSILEGYRCFWAS